MQTQLAGELFESLPVFQITGEGWKHPAVALDRPVCVIGRQERANLPLDEAHVSKVHAFVVRDQKRVYLRDLASTNGVQLNETAVQEAELSDEDVLRIGTFELRCASGFSAKTNGDELAAVDTGEASSAPAARLHHDGQEFPFPPRRHTLLIGRRPQCDLRLEHPSVAPVHAIVFEIDGQRFVQDLASPIGTKLNGQRVHRAQLNDADELLVGEVALRYVLEHDHDQPQTALEGELADSIFGTEAAAQADVVDSPDASQSGRVHTVIADDDLMEPAVDATGYSADESIELDVKPGPDDVMEAADDPIEIEEIDIEDIEDIDDAHDVDDAPIPIEAVEDDAPVDDDEPEMELRLHTTSEDAEAEETGDVDEVPALEFTPFEPIHDESPSQPTEAPSTQEGLSEKNPKLELISELVEEVAEKAEELKEAWTELRFDEDDDSAQ